MQQKAMRQYHGIAVSTKVRGQGIGFAGSPLPDSRIRSHSRHALHQQYSRHTPSIIRGIGDDAAVIASRAGTWTVLTTDLLTERVHFDLRTAAMADIGFRAAAANLSDIAAMEACPQYLLVSLLSPATAPAAMFINCTEG